MENADGSDNIPTFLSKTFEILEVFHVPYSEFLLPRHYQLDQEWLRFRSQESQIILLENIASALPTQQLQFFRPTSKWRN